MSGGAYGYLYERVQDMAERLRHTDTNMRRAAFRVLLLRVAEAMRAIEWNDSGDGDDREERLIAECLGGGLLARACVREAAVARCDELRREVEELRKQLEEEK